MAKSAISAIAALVLALAGGQGSDANAVVDERLRVRGLRVADASIMLTLVFRQHQRASHHDRRERRGDDLGGRRRRVT